MARTTRTVNDITGTTTETTDTPQDSIEVSVNAKGEPSWCVKVYGHDAGDMAARLKLARALAEEHATQIRAGKASA